MVSEEWELIGDHTRSKGHYEERRRNDVVICCGLTEVYLEYNSKDNHAPTVARYDVCYYYCHSDPEYSGRNLMMIS